MYWAVFDKSHDLIKKERNKISQTDVFDNITYMLYTYYAVLYIENVYREYLSDKQKGYELQRI